MSNREKLMVLGVIFIGVATPTEAAALGAPSTAMYRNLTVKVVESVMSTVLVSVVVLRIIPASNAFSQVLAFTGASRGLVEMVADFDAARVVVLVLMMLIVPVLGMFIDQISVMMITVPIYFPLAAQLGFAPIWFGILMLLNMEVVNTTRPSVSSCSSSMAWSRTLPWSSSTGVAFPSCCLTC